MNARFQRGDDGKIVRGERAPAHGQWCSELG
jgi:hypothetical protein